MVLMDVIILMDRVEKKPDIAAWEHQPTYPRSLISAFDVWYQESIIDKIATRKITTF